MPNITYLSLMVSNDDEIKGVAEARLEELAIVRGQARTDSALLLLEESHLVLQAAELLFYIHSVLVGLVDCRIKINKNSLKLQASTLSA